MAGEIEASRTAESWPPGDGEMARLIRGRDWAATPLGPIEAWPPGLRTLAGLMLGSRMMMCLMWGRAGLMLYNDAYARGIGGRHPGALGRPVFEVWSDVRPAFEPLFEQAWAGEEAVARDLALRFARPDLPRQEAWYDLTYTPVRDEGGQVAGVQAVVVDTTERVLTARAQRESKERDAFLLRLSDALRPLADPVEVQGEAARLLREHFDAGWCYYVEWDETGTVGSVLKDDTREGLPSMVGLHDVSDAPEFTGLLRSGDVLNVSDFASFPLFNPRVVERYTGIGIRSVLGPSLVKDGRLIATLSLADTSPRDWSENDVALVGEVAERTWAALERARAEAALRDGEERFRSFAEASTDVLWIVDAETRRLEYLSPAFERVWGAPREAVAADLSVWADSVLPEDRPGPGEGLEAALAGRASLLEYRIRRPDGEVRHIIDTGFPILGPDGRVRRAAGIAQDLTDRRRMEIALAASERRMRRLVEGIPQLVWSAVGDGQWTWASPQWEAFTGQPEPGSRGRGWLRMLHPDDQAAAEEAWAAADAAGGFDVKYRIRRARDGRYRWFATRAMPIRDEAGRIVEWLGTCTDIDDLRRLEEQARVLVAELQHRTRNLVGVVRSIADRTVRSSRSLGDFQALFSDRMSALARVQGLLSRRDAGQRVTLEEVIRTELAGLSVLDGSRGGPRVTLEGPEDVRLRDAGVQTFALALHELATNAVKHGALSRPGGRLRVRWGVERVDGEEPSLTVTWQESGVAVRPPPPDGPGRRGYGRELIERALPFQLGARTEWDLAPDGLRCVIVIPHTDARTEGSA